MPQKISCAERVRSSPVINDAEQIYSTAVIFDYVDGCKIFAHEYIVRPFGREPVTPHALRPTLVRAAFTSRTVLERLLSNKITFNTNTQVKYFKSSSL